MTKLTRAKSICKIWRYVSIDGTGQKDIWFPVEDVLCLERLEHLVLGTAAKHVIRQRRLTQSNPIHTLHYVCASIPLWMSNVTAPGYSKRRGQDHILRQYGMFHPHSLRLSVEPVAETRSLN